MLLHHQFKDKEKVNISPLQSGAMSKNSTLSHNSTLPRHWKEMDYEEGGVIQHRHPIKRSNSKASSILSVETVSF